MKLPIGFGNKFFFRVIFPGAILCMGLLKPTYILVAHAEAIDHLQIILVAEIFILGWCFVVLDMPIYMLFEGRRYWPVWLLSAFQRIERHRLASLYRTMRVCEAREASGRTRFERMTANKHYLEAAVEISNFPLDAVRSMPGVVWPTRLGNLIAAYEQYPSLKYGLDAVFFWPRIWVSIDQPLREEIDNQQAQADGLLYSVLAFVLSGAAFALYSLTDIGWPTGSLPEAFNVADGPISVACLIAAFIVYRISLHTHRQFGELFKAVFDQHKDKLALEENQRLVAQISGDPGFLSELEHKKNTAVWRFLRWHRVRLRGEKKNRRVRMP